MDEQKILETFGFNLKMYRTKLKLSQDNIVDKTGMSKAYISNIENGKHNLSLINALKLSDAVGKNIESMLKEIE
ncbi:helix-turn-helix transcriptional regulator [bacterium]|nr:helix-turn-helix transcriptional regulator [bacterium]MBR1618550.1 helix-turn-helix transcriptional regulator [bacterium]